MYGTLNLSSLIFFFIPSPFLQPMYFCVSIFISICVAACKLVFLFHIYKSDFVIFLENGIYRLNLLLVAKSISG